MSQKQLYLAAMENNMKSCLNLQATPRGQQAEISQTSRLNLLLRRKGCSDANGLINQANNKSNIVIINSSSAAGASEVVESTHNQMQKTLNKESCQIIKRNLNANQSQRKKTKNYNNINNNNNLINLICLQIVSITLILLLVSCYYTANGEPIPASQSAILQANNNSGGARSATTKALRGPPMNGSIFGKRSLMSASQQLKARRIQSASRDIGVTNAIQNENDKIEEYNDVITDIIEDFLAKNADGKCFFTNFFVLLIKLNIVMANKFHNNGCDLLTDFHHNNTITQLKQQLNQKRQAGLFVG